MQFKKAFTMIEIVFVIIIIGILASVYIPRLATTRDDAKVALSLSDLSLLVRELGNYYTAMEKYDTNMHGITNLTNIKLFLDTDCSSVATEAISGNTYYYCTSKSNLLEPCVGITLKNKSGVVILVPINNPIGNICKGVQQSPQFIKKLSRTFKMGGERIKY